MVGTYFECNTSFQFGTSFEFSTSFDYGLTLRLLHFSKIRSVTAEILPVHVSYMLCAFVHIEDCTQAFFHHWLFVMSMVDI